MRSVIRWVKDSARKVFDPSRRGKVHALSAAVIAATGGAVGLTGELAPLVVAAVVAVFDMGVALTYSRAGWRTALYGLVIAVQPLAVLGGMGTATQWAAGVGVLGALVGASVASAWGPVPGRAR